MTRPGPVTYLFGNPLSFIGLNLLLLILGAQYFMGGGSGVATILCLIVTAYTHKAHGDLSAYQAWQREWKAMGGELPRRLPMPSAKFMRVGLGVAIWCLLARYCLDEAENPDLLWPIVLFWLATCVGIFVAAVRFVWKSQTRKKKTTNELSVRVCIEASKTSNARVDLAYSALPKNISEIITRYYI